MEQTTLPKRNLPRDVFLHLFAIVALYWSAISFITLCWQYVNYFFPDALSPNYGFSSSMRFALASLFIVFPLFILVSWLLNRIYTKESQVRDSKVRKWLIYLTLFITALVIIGDLVFVINTFLNGELTARFILKALSVVVVAGVIFGYYLDDVRSANPSKLAKPVAWAVSLIILVSVVGAFFIVGSPQSARKAQFDQQRIGGLQNIQYQVVNYWQRKQVLPPTLAALTDPLSGFSVPNDPETNQPYEYSIKDAGALKFELCATFNLENKMQTNRSKPIPAYPEGYYGEFSQNWDHGEGRTCFERQIDKQLHPPLDKGVNTID